MHNTPSFIILSSIVQPLRSGLIEVLKFSSHIFKQYITFLPHFSLWMVHHLLNFIKYGEILQDIFFEILLYFKVLILLFRNNCQWLCRIGNKTIRKMGLCLLLTSIDRTITLKLQTTLHVDAGSILLHFTLCRKWNMAYLICMLFLKHFNINCE